MDIKIQGKVVQVLEEQSGEGKNGAWRKRDFILQTKDQYPKKICITQWGDKIDQQAVSEGDDVEVSVDIQSREYKGNWYTDVKAWKVEQPQAPQNLPPSAENMTFEGNQDYDVPDVDEDDLPF